MKTGERIFGRDSHAFTRLGARLSILVEFATVLSAFSEEEDSVKAQMLRKMVAGATSEAQRIVNIEIRRDFDQMLDYFIASDGKTMSDIHEETQRTTEVRHP